MGLLDEAIREHLELKRRRGADPSEVARQEQELLAPELLRDHPHAEQTGAVLQETAELDMGQVLHEQHEHEAGQLDADEPPSYELPPEPMPGQEAFPFE